MAEDFGYMSDAEMKDLVLQELRAYPEIDVDLIEVNVKDGAVSLSGRVGTEQEVQQAEHVLTDLLGVERVANELIVDELVRGERSEAADDAWAEDDAAHPQHADGPRTSDEAAHLMENLDAEQFGTSVPQEAVQRGTAYEPPDTPPQEGSRSREDH